MRISSLIRNSCEAESAAHLPSGRTDRILAARRERVIHRECRSVFALVRELSELRGATGHDDAVQDWLDRRWSRFAQDLRRTRDDNALAAGDRS